MAAFKLPRLKSNLAIVNSQGRPTDFFLRLFNIDMAQRLETIINDQQAIIDAIVAAQAAAQAAQDAADAAQATADAAATGAAADRTAVSASVTSTTFVNIASIYFPGRLANGLWDFSLHLSGYGDGLSSGDVELQVIESGAVTPLTSASVTVPNGPPTSLLSASFTPVGPYDQTVPAGDIALLLQARRMISGDTTNLTGEFYATYTPRPA